MAPLACLSVGCATFGPFAGEADAPSPTRPAASEVETTRGSFGDLPTPLLGPDDAVVRVVAGGVACSGTLIAADRVLTAHHCVAERNDGGAIVGRDIDASTLRIELGGDYLPWGEVGVRAIVAPECGHAAGVGDIAVLVLDRSLAGAPTMSVRLEAPAVGEVVEPVGFGRCALSADGIRRRARLGGRIDATATTRFRLDAGICPGDSGGPAVDGDGRVVGVISASVMDQDETTRGRTEFTRLDAWRSLFATARLVAEGASPAELPPIDGCSG